MRILRLDFETFSALDIKKVGAHKYARHPSTEVLMAAYHIDGVPYHWDATRGGMPANLEQALHDPDVIVRAFNAQFERLILWHVLQIRVPIERFQCTMVRAYRHSFKGNMFEVGEQLGLPAHLLKSKAGGPLIHRFCKPAPANHKADRYTRETDPEKWQQFIEYNIQDVVTEAAIDARLDEYYPTPQFERDLYVLDQIINDRGVPVDTQMIAAAQRIANVTKARLLAALRDLTGLRNPNSSAQLIPWLLSREAPVPRKWSAAKKQSVHTLDKDAIERMLKFELSGDVRRVLELKRQIGKTSITKYKAFEQAEDQGVVRGMFQINGAQRTGRWAGRVVQLHNLATPRIKDLDTAAEIVRTGNADLLAMFYDDPIQTLSYTIRPVIYSGPDKVWNVSDLGSIESRTLGYHSGCERINRIFAEGKDTYKDFATELYGIRYEEVTKPQRTFAKPPTLGCFAANTEVLTRVGWKAIVDIDNQDELWDGIEWVSHGGLLHQGTRLVVNRHGVCATPDHRILTGHDRWTPWSELAGENYNRALQSARGFYMNMTESTGSANANAAPSNGYTPAISIKVKLFRACLARIKNWRSNVLTQLHSAFPSRTMTGLLTASTPSADAAPILKMLDTKITAGAVYSVNSRPQKKLWPIISLWKVGIARILRSTVKTIKVTMSRGTFDSLIEVVMRTTRGLIKPSGTKGKSTQRHNSGNYMRPPTDAEERLLGKFVKDSRPNRSSKIKLGAEVPTYDILNAGPRNRFFIRTDGGPVIAHNCGYRLGGPGLVAYAAGMGVEMTKAEGFRAVRLYRKAFPEVVNMWYWLEDADMRAVKYGERVEGYGVRIWKWKDMLCTQLPSGRIMYYHKPEFKVMSITFELESGETKTVEKETLTFMGTDKFKPSVWTRVPAHGGVRTENIIQASARDVLAVWQTRAHQAGFDLRLHVHDEVGALENSDRLEELNNLIRQPIEWAPALHLDAAGYVSHRYRKD